MIPLQDMKLSDSRLETDDSLDTAVYISLFTDARAKPDDQLPNGASDLRGWWGDTYSEHEGDSMGSRLWTLLGQRMDIALASVDQIVRDALAWMIEDGFVDKVEVIDIARIDVSAMRFTVRLYRPNSQASSFGPFEVQV